VEDPGPKNKKQTNKQTNKTKPKNKKQEKNKQTPITIVLINRTHKFISEACI
jgi:hypothetical protein